jgi:hypothetical protein
MKTMPTVAKITNQFETVWVDPEYVFKIAGRYRVKCLNSAGYKRSYAFHINDPKISKKYKESHNASFIHKYEFNTLLSPVQHLVVLVASRYELIPIKREEEE